jgi:integrase
MTETTLAIHPAAGVDQAHPFDEWVALALQTVAPSSARIYAQTFALWRSWCAAQPQAVDPLDLRPAHVLRFLSAQNTTRSTRQRQLSALRKLAQMAYILAPTDDNRRIHESLKIVKAPIVEGSGKERSKRALAPSQADKVLRAWDQPTNAHRRNRALIAVLALAALRRSEAAALEWRDIDFENGVVSVRHGKGDRAREVPLAGDLALEALRAWQRGQGIGRTFVFCPVERGDHLGKDKPIQGTDVYRIVEQTEAVSGVEFKPHDLRRTFITEALETGTPLATVQAAAGHASGETTLRYAQTVDARQARKTLKLRYG